MYDLKMSRAIAALSAVALGLAACAPLDTPMLQPAAAAPTSEPTAPPIETTRDTAPPTQQPTQTAAPAATPTDFVGWPTYVLDTTLPEAPAEARMYIQTMAEKLPEQDVLTSLWDRLLITGTVSSRIDEGGDRVSTIVGPAGNVWVSSTNPLMLTLQNGTNTIAGPQPEPGLALVERERLAGDFLNARGLLDFPYRMEAPVLSRNRDSAIRVVPLIDDIPLADYDALNGRLLVEFSAQDEVAVVFWRPLSLAPGDPIAVTSAETAWEQLQFGAVPTSDDPGQCWQASVLDSAEINGVASPLSGSACVGYSSGPIRRYAGATITQVELVYFARDLNLGMSPFAFPEDSPARLVYPMWQFTGVTDDGRDVQILWPATAPVAP